MNLTQKQLSLYSYCFAAVACIVPMPEVTELNNNKYLTPKISEHLAPSDGTEMNFPKWLNSEKVNYKHESLHQTIQITPLGDHSFTGIDNMWDLISDNSSLNIVSIEVQEANLDLSKHEILYFDEGPVELIDEKVILNGTKSIPKESKYLI